MGNGGPPRLAEWLLRRLVGGSIGADAVVGDLAEEHHAERRARGRLGADVWYWREAAGVAGRVAVALHRAHRPALSPFPIPGDSFMSGLWRDLRLAARLITHQRAFALIIVLTLAVGLAANATVLALVDGLVLRPFPLRDIDRLVQVFGVSPEGGPVADRAEVSPADFVDFQRETRSTDLIALQWWDATIAGRTEPERLQGFKVSPAFFGAMGVAVAAGRGFLPEEALPGRDRVAVISDALWKRRFAGDPQLVGRTVMLEGEPHLIVGIAPPKFDYPYGSEVWAPLAFTPDALSRRQSRYLSVIGRLHDGVAPAVVQAEIAASAARLTTQYPTTNRGWTVNVMPLAASVVDVGAASFLVVQQVATLLVLLLACANVANLLIVRAADRSKELALRVALGASRWRVIRLLVIESLALAIAGAVSAIPLTWAALAACRAAMPPNIARFIRGWDEVDVDLRVVGGLALLAVASTVAFGLLPALRASQVSLNDALKTGGRAGGGGGRHRLRHAMVVVEVAMALTLLIAAGLSVRGTTTVLFRDDGYDPDGVMTLRVSLLGARYETPEKQRAFFEGLVDDARGALGIEGAALVNVAPASMRNATSSIEIDGHPVTDAAERRSADVRTVTPGYFQALRIRLIAGRDFGRGDTPEAQPVAIVSETMARRYWKGEDPIGRRFRSDGVEGPWRTVVGISRDVHHTWFMNDIAPTFYLPFAQQPASDMVLMLRGAGDPSPLAAAGRQMVLARDAGQPVYEVRSLRQVRSEGAVGLTFAATFMGVFGLVGLLLAGVGIYAIMAYAVRQRTHEIGVRLALGARPREVLAATLGRGLRLTAIGLVVGLAGAYALGSLMERTLFGSIRVDALTFVVFTAVLAFAAVAASIVPARRALRVDPMIAIRHQ
ncbi:MAG: ABC transporter permease [Vicinamibacteraceae bacterium]